MNQSSITKVKHFLPYAALLLLPAVLFLLLTNRGATPYQEVHGENGVWDLRDFDFENYNALLVGDVAFIPYALLAPDEFSALSDSIVLGSIGNVVDVNFLTSRDIILLPDDGWFTFTRNSITYAQRQYVNGVWLSNTGRSIPGDNRRNETPDTGRIIFTARPVEGVIELVQQSSNFVHRQGNRHWAWQVSQSTGLIYESRAADFRQGMVMGSYFLLSLIFLVLFFMLQKNRGTLYFSLFCFIWFLRVSVMEMRPVTVLAPWLDWTVKFRIEYISSPAAAILTLAIINILFPNVLNKTVVRIFYIISAALIALNMFADTVFMSQVGLVSYVIYITGIVYLLGCIAFKVRNTTAEQKILISGIGLYIFATVSDIVLFVFYNYGFTLMPFQLTGMAMMVFALCQAVAIFIATMKEVEAAKRRERAAKEAERFAVAESAALDSLNRMKTVYLTDLTHETKTPLTIVSVHVQKALHRYEKNGGADEQIADSLKRAQEVIMRMSRMVENALKMSSLQETDGYAKILDVAEIIGISAEANRSFIEKRGNAFIVSIEKNLPSIMGKADEIVQVVLNVLTNANNHTQNGEISLNARSFEAGVMVTIADNGTGIPAELLPFVFERGVSGGSGTGFGLAICKNTIETHGGTIEIKSEAGKGTAVTFTLPVCNKESEVSADE
ncbi:MAG: sensor histidine kinase [Oscillospiraceae bacterium]|nr:sensor histidine kinase [Oscillospiraceae bacterium]MCL2279006.1 sensor histidine kinase [Oscillospiraceae bacterium]